MLAKSAAERPPMSEVAATLERVIAQRGGRARTSETRLTRSQRRRRRSRR